MKLSTKGRYAVVALADIALQRQGDLVSLSEISRRQNISLPYLFCDSHMFPILTKQAERDHQEDGQNNTYQYFLNCRSP